MQTFSNLLLDWHAHQPLLYAAISVSTMVVVGTTFALLTHRMLDFRTGRTEQPSASDASDR